MQDTKGFMWFGTEDGLNRFDGHQFRIYRYNSYDPESLPNDRIISLFEDSAEQDMGLHQRAHLLLRLRGRRIPPPGLPRRRHAGIFPASQGRQEGEPVADEPQPGRPL